MLICLEGPSAVGKTSTANALGDKLHAYVIPEVNLLFTRPPCPSPNWYFDRQVERWQIAQEKLATFDIVVLDGDLLQPVWYNWIYQMDSDKNLSASSEYFRSQIAKKQIALPDAYFLLSSPKDKLKSNKELDVSRNRRNFEKHLQMVAPQKAYFKKLSETEASFVHFLDSFRIESNVEKILKTLPDGNKKTQLNNLRTFGTITDWLNVTNPKTFT